MSLEFIQPPILEELFFDTRNFRDSFVIILKFCLLLSNILLRIGYSHVTKKHLNSAFMIIILNILLIGAQPTNARDINLTIMQVPTIDGIVTSGEYISSKSFDGGDYQLYWEVIDDTSIAFGIVVKTMGWVAIGFDPTSQMLNADIIFGWIESDGTVSSQLKKY
jgi:hypothetical protein